MMTVIDFVFSKLRTPKTESDKRLKSPVSEDASTSNMVNVPKHCWNLHHIIFVILIDHWKVNWVGRSLSYWHAKYWDCLLTHLLPMKSILFLKELIQRYQLRCNYLRNKKFLFMFCCIFKIQIKFWTFFKKRWPSQLFYYRNYGLWKRG